MRDHKLDFVQLTYNLSTAKPRNACCPWPPNAASPCW
jgi:hypothetical protein